MTGRDRMHVKVEKSMFKVSLKGHFMMLSYRMFWRYF